MRHFVEHKNSDNLDDVSYQVAVPQEPWCKF